MVVSAQITPNPSAAQPKKNSNKKTITAVAKAQLLKHFKDTKWSLNKHLPRGQFEGVLKEIVERHVLEKTQVCKVSTLLRFGLDAS